MPAARYPRSLPKRYRKHWAHPWRIGARSSQGFRRWLLRNGYLSPHFTKADARCKCGEWVPASLIRGAQDQAFRMEKLRHRLGDKPLPVGSWYRPRWYNAQIGGASNSQHITGRACDIFRETVTALGGAAKFDRIANEVYANGGFGAYPAGSRHTDVRGYRARWSSY